MSKAARQPDEPSFEDAMQRLDEIIHAMETDRMPLEEMISHYEEGARLLKSCRQRIEQARRRVELITTDLEAGKATLKPFDAEAGAEDDADADPDARQSPPKRRKSASDEEIRLF